MPRRAYRRCDAEEPGLVGDGPGHGVGFEGKGEHVALEAYVGADEREWRRDTKPEEDDGHHRP
jgi:hypothetical protein